MSKVSTHPALFDTHFGTLAEGTIYSGNDLVPDEVVPLTFQALADWDHASGKVSKAKGVHLWVDARNDDESSVLSVTLTIEEARHLRKILLHAMNGGL